MGRAAHDFTRYMADTDDSFLAARRARLLMFECEHLTRSIAAATSANDVQSLWTQLLGRLRDLSAETFRIFVQVRDCRWARLHEYAQQLPQPRRLSHCCCCHRGSSRDSSFRAPVRSPGSRGSRSCHSRARSSQARDSPGRSSQACGSPARTSQSGSSPARSSQAGSSPARSSQAGSSPARNSPVRSSPVRSSGSRNSRFCDRRSFSSGLSSLQSRDLAFSAFMVNHRCPGRSISQSIFYTAKLNNNNKGNIKK